MNWSTEPATEQQLSFLQHCGYVAEHPLTRSDAAELIKQFREQSEQNPGVVSAANAHNGKPGVYHLGLAGEECMPNPGLTGTSGVDFVGLAQNIQSGALSLKEMRQEFWLDTCREATEMHSGSPQVFELYQKHGCRFAVPSREEVQEVLDALDSALKNWEVEHPELFFQTLEMNFPELVKHHA